MSVCVHVHACVCVGVGEVSIRPIHTDINIHLIQAN